MKNVSGIIIILIGIFLLLVAMNGTQKLVFPMLFAPSANTSAPANPNGSPGVTEQLPKQTPT